MLRRWAVVGALALFGCESLRKPVPPEPRHEDTSTHTRPVGRPFQAAPETARPMEPVAAVRGADKAGEGVSATPSPVTQLATTTPEEPDHLTAGDAKGHVGDRDRRTEGLAQPLGLDLPAPPALHGLGSQPPLRLLPPLPGRAGRQALAIGCGSGKPSLSRRARAASRLSVRNFGRITLTKAGTTTRPP